jgi:hypothetical protein
MPTRLPKSGVQTPQIDLRYGFNAVSHITHPLTAKRLSKSAAPEQHGPSTRVSIMPFICPILFHDPIPGDPRPHQAIHADRSFFPHCTAYLNVVWAIDEMTEKNGATRLVPGSHQGPWPVDVASDPKADIAGEIYATCPSGSAIILHGDVWHGGRANFSSSPRRAIHLGFSCPNTRPQYEIAGSLSEEIRERLGDHCRLIPDHLASFDR